MNTALLIIDAQTDLINAGAWNADSVINHINRLITTARENKVPVIFIRDRRVGPDGSVHSAINRDAQDSTLEKSYCDSFKDTNLQQHLIEQGINRLIVAGLQSEYCIDTSCRRAISLGYQVVLAGDAHTTFDNGIVEAPQIIAHHNHVLNMLLAGDQYVLVMDTNDIDFSG